jgi:hypothetical protein
VESPAGMRIEIEENFVLPAVCREPVAQSDRFGIVGARMAQKDARHDKCPEEAIAPGQAYWCRRPLSRCHPADKKVMLPNVKGQMPRFVRARATSAVRLASGKCRSPRSYHVIVPDPTHNTLFRDT